MTVDCSWELQKAVYAALSGDSTLAAMVSGVYNHVPQDTAFPYVKLENIMCVDWSTKTNSGVQAILNIAVLSRGRGAKEVLNIMAEIRRILDNATLIMTGCTMVNMKFAESRAMHVTDGITWNGGMVFNVLVQRS